MSLRSATEPIDDTLTGELMEGVLAAFAQFDNDVRSDRTRARMRAALRGGEPALLVNLSRGGALLETSQRVLPGRRYVLHWRRAGGFVQ